MNRVVIVLMLAGVGLMAPPSLVAQSKKTPPKKTAPARKAPPPASATVTRMQVDLQCPAELGIGIRTKRRFCDVLTGRDPKDGILVTIPPHRGTVTLSFELHNRHTYSEELVKAKQAFRQYTASIGVLTMDNTLIERAGVQADFRSEQDLFDRIGGGAGPGGMKAVAPVGDEFIVMQLPEDVTDQVSILGEKLSVVGPEGTDNFSAPGRPVATISNVMIEYRPGPPPRKP